MHSCAFRIYFCIHSCSFIVIVHSCAFIVITIGIIHSCAFRVFICVHSCAFDIIIIMVVPSEGGKRVVVVPIVCSFLNLSVSTHHYRYADPFTVIQYQSQHHPLRHSHSHHKCDSNSKRLQHTRDRSPAPAADCNTKFPHLLYLEKAFKLQCRYCRSSSKSVYETCTISSASDLLSSWPVPWSRGHHLEPKFFSYRGSGIGHLPQSKWCCIGT